MRDDRELPLVLQSVPRGRISRRTVLKRAAAFGVATPAVMALLAACGGEDEASETPAGSGGASGDATTATTESGETATADATSSGTTETGSSSSQGQGKPGGTLTIAQFQEAPSLDLYTSTSFETALIGWLLYEPLFTWSDSYEVIPMLAESHEVSDDGLLQTITIRQGVPFHNGQELVAADVIASIQHWGTRSSVAEEMLALIEEITAVDDSTIEFHFTEAYSPFASLLGMYDEGCAIYPESLVSAAGDNEVAEYVGTGPYKFVSWDRGQAIRIERFEDYAALPGEPNGYGGHKHAYLDAFEFIPVADEAARTAGLRAGDYDYAERLSGDQVPTLEQDDSIAVTIVPASGWDTFLVNWRSPLTGDLKIRQAIQAALSMEPILEAGRGSGFYQLYSSLMPEGTVWYTEAGSELYNQGDRAKAEQLLQEAGYDGTPLRMMTTQADLSKYQASIVIKQQLEEAGFVVDLQIYDWATVMDRRSNPDMWEALVTNLSFQPDPTMFSAMKVCDYVGWWCSDDATAALDGLFTETDFDARYDYWEQLHTLYYEEVGQVYLGQTHEILAHTSRLQGLPARAQVGAILWNAWLEE